jgi:transcriptional regulator with XRE-family HTH domain
MSYRLLEIARQAAGLTQADVANSCRTSRNAVSAYENGHKSPTLATVDRLLDQCGFDLTIERRVSFQPYERPNGLIAYIPNRLWRLPIKAAFAIGDVGGYEYDLADRLQRARCYSRTIVAGSLDELSRNIDGALLIDLWEELVIPMGIRSAWQPAVAAARR